MAPCHCVLLAFLSVVLLVVQAGVIPDEPENRIIGGKDIEYSDAPWMAFLRMLNHIDNNYYRCGGSIIHKDWVLTAAHCTAPYYRKNIQLRVGSKYSQGGGMELNVQRLVYHKDYDSLRIVNDISLLKTDESIPLGNLMKPIKLPAQGIRATIGKQMTVSGWGVTENGETSEWLKTVAIKTRPVADCRPLRMDAATQVCAGLYQKGACHGDSGGPLVDGGVAVGIVSYGTKDRCADIPSVYTDVGVFIGWIKEYVPL